MQVSLDSLCTMLLMSEEVFTPLVSTPCVAAPILAAQIIDDGYMAKLKSVDKTEYRLDVSPSWCRYMVS